MAGVNDFREGSVRRGATGQNSFDELAKGLASGTITRVQALKLIGAAVLGTMLVPLLPRRAFADSEDGCPAAHDPCGDICCRPGEECCGNGTCCGAAEKCCGDGICCGAAEDCCAGTCCEHRKDCVDGQCVCSPQFVTCGSECCDPILETCVGGQCRNLFCESCWAEGGNCCQDVTGGVLVGQACCSPGESTCMRGGEGCICCPEGTRCPDIDLGEAFACVSL